MVQPMKRVALFFYSLFFVLGLYLTGIQFFQGDELSAHALNRRTWEAFKTVPRGNITDKNGEILAESAPAGKQGYIREYPYDEILAPVTGFVSGKYGKAAIESYFNQYLSGIENPQNQLGPISAYWNKRNGYNVVLTIDAGLQETAYYALGNRRGAVIALDPKTGGILAMVSKPSFSPDSIDQYWEKVSRDERSPLLNRATQGLYPPGSAIKPLIAAAALEERVTDTKKLYQSPGYLKIGNYTLNEIDSRPLGDVNIEKAMALSSNVAFAKMGLELGRTKVGKYFEKFGFQQTPPLNLAVERGRLPEFGKLADGELAQTSIGQGELLVTPLEMALMTSAFANNGTVMQPMIASAITDTEGKIVKKIHPEVWLQPIKSSTAETVKELMGEVVEWGTGTAASVSGIRVAGKTGTAENAHGAPHAWFVGFAPLEKPEIVVVVIVENGGSGGAVAAPIARSILREAL